MYEQFYGLSGKPFSLLPDADFLYLGKRHKRVMNLLAYGMLTEAGFIVITGEVGAGKTTLIRRYLRDVGPDITVGVLTNTSATFGSLLGWVSAAFDLGVEGKDQATLYNNMVNFFLAQYAKGKRTVLIIDEAQNLGADKLEDLRMISNINNEKDQLLQLVLVGQPELLETLNRHEMRQFVQRVSVHCHLNALLPEETAAYVRHRLGVVGGAPDLFDAVSLAAVHYFSGGVPRLINLLCDFAMVYGFSEDKSQIRLRDVIEVARDRLAGGLTAFRSFPHDLTLHMMLRKLMPQIKRGLR